MGRASPVARIHLGEPGKDVARIGTPAFKQARFTKERDCRIDSCHARVQPRDQGSEPLLSARSSTGRNAEVEPVPQGLAIHGPVGTDRHDPGARYPVATLAFQGEIDALADDVQD